MRRCLTALVLAFAVAPALPSLLAQTTGATTRLPSNWTMRLDDPAASAASVRAEADRGGLHVVSGPAAIYYRSTTAAGTYVAAVRFTSPRPTGASPATGGYGLLVGGADLDGASPQYTAFLIRPTGEYAIFRYAGSGIRRVVDWQKHAALPGAAALPTGGDRRETRRDDSRGRHRALESVMQVDAGREDVRLLVNGAEIASVAAADIDTQGIVGVRVESGADVTFGNLDVTSSKR